MGDPALDRGIVDRVLSRRGALRAGGTGIGVALSLAALARTTAGGSPEATSGYHLDYFLK
jgi:hypothetical protein